MQGRILKLMQPFESQKRSEPTAATAPRTIQQCRRKMPINCWNTQSRRVAVRQQNGVAQYRVRRNGYGPEEDYELRLSISPNISLGDIETVNI